VREKRLASPSSSVGSAVICVANSRRRAPRTISVRYGRGNSLRARGSRLVVPSFDDMGRDDGVGLLL